MPGVLAGLIAKASATKVGSVIKDIGDTVGQFIQTKEEKAAFELKLKEIEYKHQENTIAEANDLEKAYLVDTQDARKSNVEIQNSDKASWLAKNIAYILDIAFTVAFIAMLIIIIYKQVPESNKELFYTSFGLLGGYVSQILGFHRGTSQGSKSNGEALRKLVNK